MDGGERQQVQPEGSEAGGEHEGEELGEHSPTSAEAQI